MNRRDTLNGVRLAGAWATFGLACVYTLAPENVQAQSRTRLASLSAGTVVPVRLDTALSSKDSRKGDRFTASVRTDDPRDSRDNPRDSRDNPRDNRDNPRDSRDNPRDSGDSRYDYYAETLPRGTRIEGVVRLAKPQTDKDPGILDLDFQRIRLPNGRSYPIEGSLIGLDNKSVSRDSDGRLVAKSTHKNDRLTYVGYGAAAGLILGVLTKHTLEDVVIGGGLGYLYSSLQKGQSQAHDVTLKTGTEMGVRLDRSLSLADAPYNSRLRPDIDRRPDDAYRSNRTPAGLTGRDVQPVDGIVADEGIGVLLGDRNVSFDSNAMPILSRGEVLVPAVPVLNAAKVPFSYDSKTQTIVTSGDAGRVRLATGSQIAVVDGKRRVRLEAAAQRVKSTLYVPARFLSLATGRKVHWDAASRTLEILDSDTGQTATSDRF